MQPLRAWGRLSLKWEHYFFTKIKTVEEQFLHRFAVF